MTLLNIKALGITATLAALVFAGCSDGSDEPADETGGTPGTGGAATGGAEQGGEPTATGGANQGGTDPGTGGTPTEEVLYAFTADAEGFDYEIYEGTPPYVNLGATSTLEQVVETGSDGEPGALQLTVPFTAFNELADIQIEFADDPQDWSGRTLYARIQVVSGLVDDVAAPGGAYIFAKSGVDWVYGRGVYTNLDPESNGQWIELEFDLDNPEFENDPGFDPSAVVAIGIQVTSGSGLNSTATPTEAVVLVDQITVL